MSSLLFQCFGSSSVGASNSGGQHIDRTLPRPSACSPSSLGSALSHVSASLLFMDFLSLSKKLYGENEQTGISFAEWRSALQRCSAALLHFTVMLRSAALLCSAVMLRSAVALQSISRRFSLWGRFVFYEGPQLFQTRLSRILKYIDFIWKLHPDGLYLGEINNFD